LATVVGVLAGSLASLLSWGVHWCSHRLLQEPLGIPAGLMGRFELGPWQTALILAIPALGGLIRAHLAKRAIWVRAGNMARLGDIPLWGCRRPLGPS